MIASKEVNRLYKKIYDKLELKGYKLSMDTPDYKYFLERGIRVSKATVKKKIVYEVYDALAGIDYYKITNTYLLRLIYENI